MSAPLRTDLNAFLFAPIASDASGVSLTVLSAIARNGVDPWEEAADLAGLSRESATQRLVAFLATVPNGPAPGDDTTTLATRLVALLHRSPKPKAFIDAGPPTETLVVRSRGSNLAVYYLIALILMLIGLWTLTTRQSQIPLETRSAPASQSS